MDKRLIMMGIIRLILYVAFGYYLGSVIGIILRLLFPEWVVWVLVFVTCASWPWQHRMKTFFFVNVWDVAIRRVKSG